MKAALIQGVELKLSEASTFNIPLEEGAIEEVVVTASSVVRPLTVTGALSVVFAASGRGGSRKFTFFCIGASIRLRESANVPRCLNLNAKP